ncbi:MAG: 50S ribosomal protein L3 [Thermoplasmatota archaeon]
MGQAHRPKKGSHGFSPRVRASSQVPRWSSWPEGGDAPKIQGFAGYKAGMTHVVLVDYRPHSVTTGQEVQVAATVVEVPPMNVAAVRLYRETPYGLRTTTEAWASNVDERLRMRLTVPKEGSAARLDGAKDGEVDDVRLLAYTQPTLVTGIPKKTPEIMELRVGGGSVADRLAFAKGKLGQTIQFGDFSKVGQMIDIAAVTKGFGYQGSPVRWGVKLQSHKNSKNRRDTSPLGPFQPRFIRPTVPMPGQTGYHQRTEYNKRILKIGTDGQEVTPAGGFLNYGVVRNPYVILHGSIPGPTKRLIRFRDATRYTRGLEVAEPNLVYVSTASKQGV